MHVTRERLRALLRYCPDTGAFHWRRDNRVAGNTSGSSGYRRIGIDGRLYLAHRLAILYEAGTHPEEVDHINGDRLDNRLSNLRPASRMENSWNAGLSRANSSGHRGVSWNKSKCKWMVQVGKAHTRVTKYCTTLEEAATAAETIRRKLHNEFCREPA